MSQSTPLIHDTYGHAGYLYLPLALSGLPENFIYNGEAFPLRPEFHMSIVGVKHLAPVVAEVTQKPEAAIVEMIAQAFTDFTQTYPVKLEKYLDEFRLVTSEERNRASLIVMCKASYLAELFVQLRKAVGYDFQLPPTHVTLYARSGDGIRGIGVISPEQLPQTTIIDGQNVQAIRTALGIS